MSSVLFLLDFLLDREGLSIETERGGTSADFWVSFLSVSQASLWVLFCPFAFFSICFLAHARKYVLVRFRF